MTETITIHAQFEEIPHASKFVALVARKTGLDEKAIHHCQLAVDEVCTNIVEHGYAGGSVDNVIEVSCVYQPGRFKIIIFDDSPLYNPLERASPDPKATLDERGIGGWGLYFVKKLMNEAQYTAENGRNQITLIKSLASTMSNSGDSSK